MSQAVQNHYDRLAASYDQRWAHYLDHSLLPIVETSHLHGTESVLDAPCGTGELARRWLDRWPALNVVGVDQSPAMLLRAQAKLAGRAFTGVSASIESLPLADQQFDVVACASALHYFRSPQAALTELTRVLKPNGVLLLTDWRRDRWTMRCLHHWLRWRNPAFYQCYSVNEAIQLVQAAGLTVIRSSVYDLDRFWGMMLIEACKPA